MDTPTEKRCKKCGPTQPPKPLTDFYHDKNKKDGHSTICKDCSNKNSTRYKQEHQESITDYKHEWYLEHKSETYPKNRERILANHEVYIAYLRKYHKDKWPEIYATNIKWQKSHPEQYKAINILKSRNRRAKRLSLPAPETEKFTLQEIGDRDGWICQLCHKPVTQKKLRRNHPMGPTLDHIDPDGPHTRMNVSLAHRRCNSSRGRGRTPAQFRLLP